mmetsp:Transcript_14762/g.46219  ORF Transcript_14762/g.46219 Transcript_14762/m.46219 type:complete len:226 (+) Transcript_14762:154-831(+)
MASVPRQRAFVIMLSCLSAAAALPRPPPRKVARAFANPVLRLLPDAHRLASLRGRPPRTGPCRGRPRSSRSCEPGCAHCAAPARRDRLGPRTRFFAACAGELAVVRWVVIVISFCLLCCASRSCVLGLVLTSFHLLLSYATWLCVFGFLWWRFGFPISHSVYSCTALYGPSAQRHTLSTSLIRRCTSRRGRRGSCSVAGSRTRRRRPSCRTPSLAAARRARRRLR